MSAIASLAKLAVTFVFDPTGASAAVAVSHQAIEKIVGWLGTDDRERYEALVERARRRLEALAEAKEVKPEDVEPAATTAEVLLTRHGLNAAALTALNLKPDDAANNVASSLSELGRREEALATAEEALNIYRVLAEARPHAFLPDLASALSNLANRLSELGQREEALATAEEAVKIRRDLAEARPDAFRPDLVHSLGTLTNCYSDLGRNDEALRTIKAAVATLVPDFLSLPTAFAELMAKITTRYRSLAQDMGVELDAELLKPIAEVFERLQADQEKRAGDDNRTPES